jgi:hypothetical protein
LLDLQDRKDRRAQVLQEQLDRQEMWGQQDLQVARLGLQALLDRRVRLVLLEKLVFAELLVQLVQLVQPRLLLDRKVLQVQRVHKEQ